MCVKNTCILCILVDTIKCAATCAATQAKARGQYLAIDGSTDKLKQKHIAEVRDILSKFPPSHELVKRRADGTLKAQMDKQHRLAFPLLNWIITSKQCNIVALPRAQQIPNLGTDQQYFLYADSPEKQRRFQDLKRRNGGKSIFLWHGSDIGNWHSIMRNGIINANENDVGIGVKNGSLYGPGIYLSRLGSVSAQYAQGTPGSIALCEVIDDGSLCNHEAKDNSGAAATPSSCPPRHCIATAGTPKQASCVVHVPVGPSGWGTRAAGGVGEGHHACAALEHAKALKLQPSPATGSLTRPCRIWGGRRRARPQVHAGHGAGAEAKVGLRVQGGHLPRAQGRVPWQGQGQRAHRGERRAGVHALLLCLRPGQGLQGRGRAHGVRHVRDTAQRIHSCIPPQQHGRESSSVDTTPFVVLGFGIAWGMPCVCPGREVLPCAIPHY